MSNLDRRIAALERKTAPTEPITIVRRIVWEGQQSAELETLQDDTGKCWMRNLGESELDFIERAKVEAWRSEWGVMVLNGFVWKTNFTHQT